MSADIKARLVDKKLVHKFEESNVLLYDLRRALPVRIKANIFEDIVLNNLTEEEKSLMLEYYTFHITPDNQDTYYVMYNIPHTIKVEFIERFVEQGQFTQDEMDSLLIFYDKDNSGETYILKKNVTEIDEIKISNILEDKDLQLSEYDEREKIAELLENIEDFPKEDIFFSNMHVDLKHSFFFEHPNEHVPAMMMLEASRQLLIACCHKFGNIPFEGVSMILEGMQIDFINYLELNYPIKMVAKINRIKKRKGMWINIDMTVTFYQRNRESSVVSFIGRSITNNVFKILRTDNTEYEEVSRFSPLAMYYHNISLRNDDNGKILSKIIDLSDKGFQLKFEEPISAPITPGFEFFIFFQEVGFVHGKCELKWYKKIGEFYFGGFEITEMSKSDLDNLKEAIKRFCYVKMDREFI